MRVAVLGTYRCGSTAVAGVLHHLGVELGKPFWQDYYESASLADQLRIWWDEPALQEKTPKAERVRFLARWIEDQEQSGARQKDECERKLSDDQGLASAGLSG